MGARGPGVGGSVSSAGLVRGMAAQLYGWLLGEAAMPWVRGAPSGPLKH